MTSTFSISAEMTSLRYQSAALSLATDLQPASVTSANRAKPPLASTTDFVGISEDARDSHHASAVELGARLRDDEKEGRQLDLLRNILRQITGEEPDKLSKGAQRHHQQNSETQAIANDAPLSTVTMSSAAIEVEQFAFSFSGTISTTDGKAVSFSMELAVDRASFSNQTLGIIDGQNGNIAVNYQGSSAELTSSSFSFSLATEGGPVNGSGRLLVDQALHDISHAARPLLRDALQQSGMGDMWHDASQLLNAIA